MNEEDVRKLMLIGFEYSYVHDDWVNPLTDALEGLTLEQALWSSGPKSRCIWEIVLHLAVWLENIVERIQSGEKARPSEGAWPPLPDVRDEADWEASKKRLWDAEELVKETILTAPMEKLNGPPYGLGDLMCRFNHNAYHIGQITKMREVLWGG